MDWLLWMMLPMLISEIEAINLNPFAAFADPQYEPVADYSIRRGVYLPNMPTTSIFPLMSEESLNGMVGIPSLQSPFVNPLLQQQPSLFSVQNQNDRPKASNVRHQGGMIREQGNGQQNPRGVTLDIRGGGYRLDQSRTQRPYNPPPQGSNPTRNAGQRNPNGRNTASNVNRKQVQRPRGPTMNNPQRNIPSLPQNAEFVNPENVLPMHPRIYKQFLQQNPQAAAYLRSKKPGSPNFASGAPSNHFEVTKQTQAKLTRNRGLNPNSQLGPLSSFQNGPNNFQIQASQKPGAQLNQQFNLQGQSLPKTPTFEDFYNSDPQFYNAFSQTPEGKAVLSQMYQHFGPSANKQHPSNPSKPPTNTAPNSNPFGQTFSDINSYAAAAGYGAGNVYPSGQSANPFASAFTASEPNNAQFNRQNLQGYSLASQYNQKQPQSSPQQHQQAPVQHQQALQHPSKLQQNVQPQFSPIPSNQDYSGRQPFAEAGPLPAPNSETKKPYSQGGRNQFTTYTGPGYTEDSSSSLSAGGAEYDPSTYQSSYQEHPKVVDGSTVDHAGYASNFSPADPVENAGHVPGSTYYGYPQGESPAFGGSASRYPSTALHEISPSEGLKRPAESSTSFRTQPVKSSHSPGYWTPEQLFAPQATGLQSDSPLAYSSAISASSLQPSQDEQQDGSERAALHLPQDASSWQSAVFKPDDASSAENSEADEGGPASTESSPPIEQDDDSEENLAPVRDLQKLWTRVPQRSSSPSQRTRATTVIYRSTSPPEVVSRQQVNDELKNHRTTPSYTFQFSPSEKPGSSKSTAAWWSRKAEGGSRYKIPVPTTTTATSDADVTSTPLSSTISTTPSTTTTTTTTTAATTITDAPPTTTTQSPEPAAFTTFYYHASSSPTTSTSSEPPESTAAAAYLDATDTPTCARNNNLTYCLIDPEYPKEAIREAIERNRHPLDHFLVDISASSNLVDDHPLHSVLENSAPLQSTSVSYSFEGKVISPNAGEMQNATGCDSNVHYAKPLRALNTAGLWKVIVNVEFLDTGANYTQTVRIEECTHPPGYVATCGVHSISACLQQYKLYRLLSWEAHRGFYIDAFLLPVACFCGSQES